MKIKDKIIAHRGIHNNKDIPENSITAFKEAIKLNYPIELDVQLTKDNVLVVFHDKDLYRMTGNKSIVQNSTYKELQKFTLLNTKETIPTLEEILKLNKDKVLIDIEIKNTKRVKDTCRELMKLIKNNKNVIIKSFYPKIVKYIKKNYPNMYVGLLIDKKKYKIYSRFLCSKPFIKYLNIDFIAISKKLLKDKHIQKASKNITTLVWTIKDKKEIKNNNNLIYICNNLPYKK